MMPPVGYELWVWEAFAELLQASWAPCSCFAVCCLWMRGRFMWNLLAVAVLACVLGLVMPAFVRLGLLLRDSVQPEPAGLAASLRALPPRPLFPGELAALERDGVVVARGVFRDKELLEKVASSVRGRPTPWHERWLQAFVGRPPEPSELVALLGLWALRDRLSQLLSARFHTRWLSDGAIRSVLRDSPLGSLASSAMGHRGARILLSEVWSRSLSDRPHDVESAGAFAWHRDDKSAEPCPGWTVEPAPLLTVWLALTDAPNSLQFILGSHNFPSACPGWGVKQDCKMDKQCIEGEFARNLSRARGKGVFQTLSLQAGDVVAFRGLTLHRGLPSERVALCARFVPADYPYMGSMARQMEFYLHHYWRYKPRFCGSMDSPLFPVVHPRANSTVDAHPWPVSLGVLDLLLLLRRRQAINALPLHSCRKQHLSETCRAPRCS